MANNPLVSVIMPAYNAERTLSQSVESVLVQTFKDFELIIINDGSTDRTVEILNKLSDERVNIINIQNSGPSAARNRGISIATGEYLSFIDSDDLWVTDKIEKQLDKLKKSPGSEVVYSWTVIIDENGRYIQPLKKVSYEGDVYESMLINNFIGSGSNILATKKSVEKAGLFNEDLIYGEEWDLLIRLSRITRFTVVRDYQVFYRRNMNSLSSSVAEMEKDSLKVIEFAYSNAPGEYLKLKSKSIACLNSYISVLYMTRQSGNNWRSKSLSKALISVSRELNMITNLKLFFCITFVILSYLLPENTVRVILNSFLKFYGMISRYTDRLLFNKLGEYAGVVE